MSEKVLVVDDAAKIRSFLAEIVLGPKGHEIIMAVDGRDGLEKALSEKPDLIIVDNQMPQMSGLEMIRQIQAQNCFIPTILTTAFGSEQTAVEAFRLGVRDYVVKPFDLMDINRAVENALRETRLKRERNELSRQVTHVNQELERYLRDLNALYGIGRSVGSSLDLEQVLQRVVEAAIFVVDAEEGFLMLHDAEQNELYVRASKNLDSEAQTMRMPTRDTLAGYVMKTKKPVVVSDDKKWQKIRTHYLARTLAYVPLILEDKAIGVLAMVNRVSDKAIQKRDIRVLGALADYASSAIKNANLYSASNRERQQLSTILSQTGDPILVVDDKDRLVLVNEAARRILKLPHGTLNGRTVSQVIHQNEALAFITRSNGSGSHDRAEISLDDGSVLIATMTPIEGVGRSVVMQDVTQFKEIDRAKSEFVSMVSHDLRSPLTAILGYVQLLERAGELNDTQREFVRRVQRSVQNITSLVTDLLDLSRLETGIDLDMIAISPLETLLEIIEAFQSNISQKNLILDLDMPDQEVKVIGDPRRLYQAFSNLIGNAVKYTPPEGMLGIQMHVQDGQVIIQVSDTGVGIDPEDQPYIFDKFFRANRVLDTHEGTGLGLSIVKSIVEKHNGRIWVTSELGKGTTFTVVLPSAQAEPSSRDSSTPQTVSRK